MRTASKKRKVKSQSKRIGIIEQYKRFFVPNPSPLWRNDDTNFSVEQPSPLKVVPTETTYGVDDLVLCQISDA